MIYYSKNRGYHFFLCISIGSIYFPAVLFLFCRICSNFNFLLRKFRFHFASVGSSCISHLSSHGHVVHCSPISDRVDPYTWHECSFFHVRHIDVQQLLGEDWVNVLAFLYETRNFLCKRKFHPVFHNIIRI